MDSTRYVLDANVFIQAKRRYYGFDFCPGYWEALRWHQKQGSICSIDRVWNELRKGADDLWEWAGKTLGSAAFEATSDPLIPRAYGEMLSWARSQPHFLPAAISELQNAADGWIAAFAKVQACTVVTLEQFNPDVRKSLPLPNICRAFDVSTITPFEMLQHLKVRLVWHPPS